MPPPLPLVPYRAAPARCVRLPAPRPLPALPLTARPRRRNFTPRPRPSTSAEQSAFHPSSIFQNTNLSSVFFVHIRHRLFNCAVALVFHMSFSAATLRRSLLTAAPRLRAPVPRPSPSFRVQPSIRSTRLFSQTPATKMPVHNLAT